MTQFQNIATNEVRKDVRLVEPENYDVKISFEDSGLQSHGFFTHGQTASRTSNPMIVFIHGGGTNACYWDNELHSYVSISFFQLFSPNSSFPLCNHML
jgi:pimeloyl-ACP methyl ester carboxylesterase